MTCTLRKDKLESILPKAVMRLLNSASLIPMIKSVSKKWLHICYCIQYKCVTFFFGTDFIILLFREGCEHGLEFIRMVEEQFPNARFEKETSQEGELIICKCTT